MTNENIKIDYDNNRLSIPKFIKLKSGDNRLKCKFHRKVEGELKSLTISQNRDGRYYASILCEVDSTTVEKKPISRDRAKGIDFGVKTFLTFDDGTKIDSPMFMKKSKDKLAKHQ